jgi:hypothetical protein
VVDAPLTAAVVALRVKRRAHLAGIDPANLSGSWSSEQLAVTDIVAQRVHRTVPALIGKLPD